VSRQRKSKHKAPERARANRKSSHHRTEIVGPPAKTQVVTTSTVDLMSWEFPASDPQERRSRGNSLIAEMDNIFRGRLSPAEIDLWSRHDSDSVLDPQETSRLWDKFGQVLIEQAESLGWRIFESSNVLQLIAHWMDKDPHGIEKLKRFFDSLVRNAKIGRGLQRHSFREQEWYQTRTNALGEVKALQRKLASQFAARNEMPNPTEACSAIRTEITATPRGYKYLTANLRSFLEYIGPLSPRFVTNQFTPATVVDGWFDHQGSTAAGKSRQIISRIGSQKRR
jgi:hypothetical protein